MYQGGEPPLHGGWVGSIPTDSTVLPASIRHERRRMRKKKSKKKVLTVPDVSGHYTHHLCSGCFARGRRRPVPKGKGKGPAGMCRRCWLLGRTQVRR